MAMQIETCASPAHAGWLELRSALWPDCPRDEHLAEMAAQLRVPQHFAQFVARDGDSGAPLGLAEAALRSDYVNGTQTSPVAFLEGLYVVPAARRRGAAAALVGAVEQWARAQGCSELASDAALGNRASHRVHRALGFDETERVVYFRKALASAPTPATPARPIRLYGSQGSGSAAVEAALQMCGLRFRRVDAATWKPASALAALGRANALQQIPTLVMPDGAVLTESAAILIHLGLEHPASGLLPAAPASRAQAIRGLVFIAANCYAAIGVIDYPRRWTRGRSAIECERLRQGARARLHGCWEVFADSFAPAGAFLGGDAPGALDILASVVSRWSGARAHLRAQRPEFARLLERIDAHPALARVFRRHWPG